ncbi:MAG TPA: hypothetical protein ENH62_10095 [Marinobacter sp.]|uniref:Uncharacterized protein n=1 Tax=marine sediment metagenome TaxID=412755 RepID=A0A0F9MHE9_9ZZZZ|nr:hypothetical protein [Marinobacter sp.]
MSERIIQGGEDPADVVARRAAWTAGSADRVTLAAEPSLLELIEALIEQTPAPPNSALEDVKARLEAAKQVRGLSGLVL